MIMPFNKLLGNTQENFVPNLREIVEADDLDAFQVITREKGTVNLYSIHGTALCLCVENRSRRIFDYLMEAPDVNLDFNYARTRENALLLTVQKHHRSRNYLELASLYMYFITRLLEKGANPNAATVPEGYTAFMAACESGNDDCIHLLLSYGGAGNVCLCSWSREAFALAVNSNKCSQNTLEMLFHLNFHKQKHIKLQISTISGLIRNNHIDLLEKILRCISGVFISCDGTIRSLVEDLNQLPFRVFKDMIFRFPNILYRIKRIKYMSWATIYQNPDFVKYLKFLCTNCQNLETFYANWLLSKPSIISLNLLSEVLLIMIGNKVVLIIDMHLLYDLWGFSPLFETLLGKDIIHDTGSPHRTDFVAVHYNITLDTERYMNGKIEFEDYSLYFADKGRVRSLLELSRDATRKTIIKKYKIKKCYEFAAVCKNLNLCQAYIDILIFKRAIY